ncbi:hypothetical protein [Methylobacterium sp. BTF04]|nr:hypothetical protein [Methylobacterium sp. BTF04]
MFWSAKGRFSVGAVLSVTIAFYGVEEGNQPVGGVEGRLRRLLKRAADLG